MAVALLRRLPPADFAVVRDAGRTIVATDPVEVIALSGVDALRALDDLTPGWWAGFFSYDLGRAIERVPTRTAPSTLPDLVLARFDARAVIGAEGESRVVGAGTSARSLTEALSVITAGPARPGGTDPDDLAALGLGPWETNLGRDEFADRVQTIIGHLEAGDCYQVNLTRRLATPRTVDPVSLFAAVTRHNPAPHASAMRLAGVGIVSASPELFLRWRNRAVTTRPIKGTAPAAAATALVASAKDRAENVMIVDLARNDLGRVCEPGSISVPELCAPEAHPGLTHLVSTVQGRLRDDVGPGDLLRATFPPASVTGAPKPRVLEIIEELEPVRRGVYCGALGWIDTEQRTGDLAVAIRTFVSTDEGTSFGVGAGIVADSDPIGEWEETELKAHRLIALAGTAPTLAGVNPS